MLTLERNTHVEIPHQWKEGLLISLAGLCAVFLFLSVVDSGLARIAPVEATAAPTAAESSSMPAATPAFDYFPSHYVNQAKDVEPLIDQF